VATVKQNAVCVTLSNSASKISCFRSYEFY